MKPVKLYEIYFSLIDSPTITDMILYMMYKCNYNGIFDRLIKKLFDKKFSGILTDKFVESFNISNMYVRTYGGRLTTNKVSMLHITKPYDVYMLETRNGKHLECADDHIVYRKDGSCVFVKDLKIGDYIITDEGISDIIKIDKDGSSKYMCDLELSNK